MRLAIVLYSLFIASTAAAQPSPIRLTSPSGKLQAAVFPDSTDHLAWSLKLDGYPIVKPSLMGIDIKSADLGQNIRLGAPILSINNTSYPWKGVHNTARNHYRLALIPIANGKVHYTLECRIFDDGFAFRYIVPGAGAGGKSASGILVTGESSSWHIPNNSRIWYQENVYYYEGLHYTNTIEALGVKQLGPPVTYLTPDGLYASITEAALYDYSGMSLRSDTNNTLHAAFINDPKGWTIPGVVSPAGRAVTSTGRVVTPWRVVLVSATLDGLVNSDIIPNLNPAPDTAQFAWIKPGRAVWSYFVHDNVTTLDLEKTYVDKAAALGFEYSIVDAGWDSSWPNAMDSLKSLVHYAGRSHIGIFVWKSYASLKDDSIRKAFFRTMNEVGVAGLKIDYIDKEGFDQVRFYEKALKDALYYHLLIDFHGANKPTGYNRRFPNEITREGIYGQEWRTYTPQGPVNNAIIPFTRFLAGPADYTPGVFNSSLAYGTSRAQQLALAVIYNSPLLCWADDPAVYLLSPAENIIRNIPTTWDQTRVLPPSRIGELVAFARRKGKDWFIAVINAGDEKRIDLPLSFLGPGAFKAEIISDDLTGSDRILHSITSYTTNDTLHDILQPKGGFIARLTSTSQAPPAITIHPAGGYLQGPQEVRITTKPGAQIHYTTDGSEPNSRSPLYTKTLVLTQPTQLRAQTGASDIIAQFLTAPAPIVTPPGGIFIRQQTIELTTNQKGEMRYTLDGSEPNTTSKLFTTPFILDTSTTLKSRLFFAAGGTSEISSLYFQKVEPDPAVTTAGDKPGLQYTYYEGKWDSMPPFESSTEKKHGHILLPSLDSITTRPNEYGLQFKGWITLPETGVYTFYTISDDGSQLYIGDQKVVDNDGNHGDLEKMGDRALSKGRHPFTLNYFQNGAGQTLQLFIKGPHLEKQPIPASFFSF